MITSFNQNEDNPYNSLKDGTFLGGFSSDVNSSSSSSLSGNVWRHPYSSHPYVYDAAAAAAAAALAVGYSPFAHGPMDFSGRRKNATRETTATLKAWLYEHRKNPYPTKSEKVYLAIITKMTLTQVSTWFANARRRLKKENKMTWSPRNRNNEEDEDDDDDQDEDEEEEEEDRLIDSTSTLTSTVSMIVVRREEEKKCSRIWSLAEMAEKNEKKCFHGENPSSSSS